MEASIKVSGDEDWHEVMWNWLGLAGSAGLIGPGKDLKGQCKGREAMFIEHLLCVSPYVFIESILPLSVGFTILVLWVVKQSFKEIKSLALGPNS